MNILVYDASMLAGTAMVGAGAWMQYGAGVGLMVTGGMVLAATALSVLLVGRR